MKERSEGLEFLDSVGRYFRTLSDMFYIFLFFYAVFAFASLIIELVYTILFLLFLFARKIFAGKTTLTNNPTHNQSTTLMKTKNHPSVNVKVSVKLLCNNRTIGFIDNNGAYNEFNQLIGYYQKAGNGYTLYNVNGQQFGKAVVRTDWIFEVYDMHGKYIGLVSMKNVFQKLDKDYEDFVTEVDTGSFKGQLCNGYAVANAILFLYLLEKYQLDEILTKKFRNKTLK